MFKHLRYKGAEVAAHSESGKWTVDMLDLNDPKLFEYRSDLITAIKLIKDNLGKAQETLTLIKDQLKVEVEADKKIHLETEKNNSEIRVTEIKKILKRFTGQE